MSEDQQKPTEIDLTESENTSAADGKPGESAAEPAAEPTPTPEARIAALESEKGEMRERMLRIAADFENWKKRSRKELVDSETRAKESVLRDFLEIIDNLDRAAAAFTAGKETDANSIRDGVELVLRQFRSKLDRYHVKVVESLGQPFDPRYHEAISQLQTPDSPPGSIVHELQKGYLVGEKLLRPAMVVVAAAPPPKAAETPKPATDSTAEPAPEAPPDDPKSED
jgi:molecular chaperone GrpE